MTAGPDRGKPIEPAAPTEHVAESAALIVDPAAGRGRVGRELPGIRRLLNERGVAASVSTVEPGADPAGLARQAVQDGERFVVAVGDTATVNGVLNGLIEGDEPIEPDMVMGILAANSGCDVVRTFGLPQDPLAAMARLIRGPVYSIDIGKATSDAAESPPRYFLNMAQVGLGAAAVRRAAALPVGAARTLSGYWLSMATYRRPLLHLEGDRRSFDGRATNVIVANLQYTSGGIHLSPRSWPEDGYFDLQVFTGPKSDTFTLLPKMFAGDHLPHPNIREYRSTQVRIDADRPVPVEVDGIPTGRTPVRFEVLHRVLALKT